MTSGNDDEPIFRRCGANDATVILSVIESAFERWPLFEIDVPAIDHLRWKMTPSDGLRPDMHAVIELDGDVAAVQLRWQSFVHVGDRQYLADFGADLSVHPSAQGRGLGRILRAREDERLFGQPVVGVDTSPTNERVAHMQSDGGAIQRPLLVWARALGLRSFVGVHLANGNRQLTTATIRATAQLVRSRLRSLGRRRHHTHPKRRIESVTAFDDRVTALWETVRHEYQFARVRDAAWLNWRYLDPRAGRISVYAMTEGDRLLGYAALRRSGTRGSVLDLVTAADADGAGAELLARGVSDLREEGCTLVDCWLPPGHREESALRAAGFLPTGGARAFEVYRDRNAGIPELLEVAADPLSAIHVMAGDFDHA
jgi:GNAT superfamily N-acetyltransferase/predicted nucleic acid-binding protein